MPRPSPRSIEKAFADEVARAAQFPEETRELARAELGRILGKALPRPLIAEAYRWVDFTRDPLPDALETIAHDAWSRLVSPRGQRRARRSRGRRAGDPASAVVTHLVGDERGSARRPLIAEASRWVDFTRDPLPDALETFAHDVCGARPSDQASCAKVSRASGKNPALIHPS